MISLHSVVLVGLSAAVTPGTAVDLNKAQPCFAMPEIVFTPPTAIIDAIVGNMEMLPADTQARPTDTQFRPLAEINVTANGYGFVNKVTFRRSSGNRRVDLAIIAWSHGYRFDEGACGGSTQYSLDLKVDLSK